MSERRIPAEVALRDRASGCYLAVGPAWSAAVEDALLLDERAAADILRRFTCEPDAIELVALGDDCRAVA